MSAAGNNVSTGNAWPPIKRAIWDVLMEEQLNDGHYIKAFDLLEKLFAAVSVAQGQSGRGALADEIDAALTAVLHAQEGGQARGNAEGALRRVLWDNKAGIIAGLRHPAYTAQNPLDALAAKIAAKIAQLEHYKEHDAKLEHARIVAEGRLLQANQILHWIAEASSVPSTDRKCKNCKDPIDDADPNFCGMCREMGCSVASTPRGGEA